MKTKSWVPSGIVLVCIILTANSEKIQDKRSSNGINEDVKLYYKDTDSSTGDQRWISTTQYNGGNNADKETCNQTSVCKNEGTCNDDKVCDCKPGTSGEMCEIVEACKDGKYKSCKGENGECTFEGGKAVCKCKGEKKLNESIGHCISKWCYKYICQDGADCFYDEKTETGACNCTDKNKYFDYYTRTCKVSDPDYCILWNTSCGENEECNNGYCYCIDDAYRVGNKCYQPDLCKPNPCFSGAICSSTDGVLKCSCKEGEYFDGEKCADGSCIFGDFKATCKEPCPENLERKGKSNVCEPMENFTLCSEECGYGYCLRKKDEKKYTCSCIKSISANLYGSKDGRCKLRNDVVCASKQPNQYAYQCNCTGKYKLSSNGITCELITCLDESAQEDCKEKGTRCVMDGKQGYICECPPGYVMDEKRKMCTDPCSLEEKRKYCLKSNQYCYNSIPKWNQEFKRYDSGECRCPPALKAITKYDGWNSITECNDLAENVYVMTGIPVIKTRYEVDNEIKINEVLLNTDMINSLKTTFNFFDYGYLLDYELNGDVLNVSVWIKFAYKPGGELNRMPLQVKSVECDKCVRDSSYWPPSVLLDSKLLSGVRIEPLEFCSEKSKITLCGKEAVCKDNKCSCPRGFKTVEYSIIEKEKFTIARCEDVDECALGMNSCSSNTTCVNLLGDYYCECKANYKKENDTVYSRIIKDKSDCYDLCTPNPCNEGTCVLKEDKSFNCECPRGSSGSFCDKEDVKTAKANNNTVVVGAILGTCLGIALIAIFLLYMKMKNNSYFENSGRVPGQQSSRESR